MEKRWSLTTKRMVLVGSVVAFLLLATHVSRVLTPIILSFVLAYILSPIATFISTRLHMSRTLAVVLIYLVLIAITLTAPALLIPTLITQIEEFVETTPQLVQEIGEFIQQPLIFGDFQLEVRDIYDQISNSLQGILSSAASQAINILSNIASMLLWTVFVLVSSFYMVKDQALIVEYLEGIFPTPYHSDIRKLRTRIAITWNAFLRGQMILCLTMGLVVGITMALIGLPNAWFIGLLFGVFEFVPNLGPTIATVPTVIIAFFQGSTLLNISNGWFAVLVIVVNTALQQLENNFLVPRILGQSLNLHPLVVLTAALIGAELGGILGILLAAPIIATLRVIAEYVYARLLDLPPFPEETVQEPETVEEDEQPLLMPQPVATTESKQVE
jgi:predicted PurR-regulated permease PerM